MKKNKWFTKRPLIDSTSMPGAKRTLSQRSTEDDIVPDSLAAFPSTSRAAAVPIIDDEDSFDLFPLKSPIVKKQKTSIVVDDDVFESPKRRKLKPSGRRFDINEDSPQRPSKSPMTPSFLSTSASFSTSARRNRHSKDADFIHNSSCLSTPKKFMLASSVTTPKSSFSTLSTPQFASMSLKTPTFEALLTPKKTGTILACESPLTKPPRSLKSVEFDKIFNDKNVVPDSQVFSPNSSVQDSQELQFDYNPVALNQTFHAQVIDSDELEFVDDTHHLISDDIDEKASEMLKEKDETSQHSLPSEADDIDFDAEYGAIPIPLKANGVYNLLALSQLSLDQCDDNVLHTVYPDKSIAKRTPQRPRLKLNDDASVRAFIAAKRPDMLAEFDSQAGQQTQFLSSQLSSIGSSQSIEFKTPARPEIISSQTDMDEIPVMRTAGHHRNDTRKPIFLSVADTLNAVYDISNVTFGEDDDAVDEDEVETTDSCEEALFDDLTDCPVISLLEAENDEYSIKECDDPLEDDEELDKEEAKVPTKSYAVRCNQIIQGFRHIQLFNGPTIICDASLWVNIEKEIRVSQDTGFQWVIDKDEYLVGPIVNQ